MRSDAQGDILAVLLLSPEREFSLSELSRLTGALGATVHREVGRLVDFGLLVDRRVGRTRVVRANTSNRIYGPMSEIVIDTYGPRPVLQDVLADIKGVESAYIYGSWAARRSGIPGPPPHDIDVLVLGSPTRTDLAHASAEASRRLGREVNIHRSTRTDWDNGDGPFERTVKNQPIVELTLQDTA
ncbi:hypothetical protein [Arthrobacter sp.]|uniref:hypothetical protein n=2 Tax=Arthrobacter sp. TaxID=1667 RepID=UPI003A90F2CF